MPTSLYYIARNECVGCCFSCKKENCQDWETESWCRHCNNIDCVNQNYKCNSDLCESCRNIKCIENPRFNPMTVLMKNC